MYSIDCNEFEEFTEIFPKFYNKQQLAENPNEKTCNMIKPKFEATINKRFSSLRRCNFIWFYLKLPIILSHRFL